MAVSSDGPGFGEYYGFTSGHWGEYFDPPLEHNGKIVREKGFIADLFTNHAIEFMERTVAAAKPFFCYVPFNTPHSPWGVPRENWEHFKDKPINQRGAAGAEETIEETRCVHAMLENQDGNVGRVLKRIEELGLKDNTIVVYFSDNGPNTSRWNGGMKGRKGSTDEGGIRSTALIRWPGKIAAGSTVQPISGAIDLLPTLTSLAGIPRVGDKPLDGLDLSPLLFGQPGEWPDRLIFSEQNHKVSVRSQQFRIDAQNALFDLIADPGQTKPIAGEAQLAGKLREWKEGVVDAIPVEDTRPIPVGYPEFPWTPLPARDGEPEGTVQRSSNAPNCSYFVSWTSVEDVITWNVDVQTTGDYEAILHYTCPEADAGSTVELAFANAKLAATITPGWDPPLYNNQDTIPRPKAESTMKEFRPLALGTVHLEKGQGPLRLRATEIPGKSVADVRLLTLTLQK